MSGQVDTLNKTFRLSYTSQTLRYQMTICPSDQLLLGYSMSRDNNVRTAHECMVCVQLQSIKTRGLSALSMFYCANMQHNRIAYRYSVELSYRSCRTLSTDIKMNVKLVHLICAVAYRVGSRVPLSPEAIGLRIIEPVALCTPVFSRCFYEQDATLSLR